MRTAHTNRVRLSAAALVVAGILFVLYPAIRPFSNEASLQGAAAFASTEWLVAHVLAIVAFTLLPLGLLGGIQSGREFPWRSELGCTFRSFSGPSHSVWPTECWSASAVFG
jgi:di/tricarboxylate transporter